MDGQKNDEISCNENESGGGGDNDGEVNGSNRGDKSRVRQLGVYGR